VFDSHCHLTDIVEPVEVLRETTRLGVTSVLCCGYNRRSNEKVLMLRRCVRRLPIALGLHPWFAAEPVDRITPLLESEALTAIGECGLEGEKRENLPELSVQKRVFEVQLDIAARLSLPVTVHSRRAVRHVVEMALAFPKVKGVLHAYSGSLEQIAALLDRGWKVGIGGASTRPSAHELRRMISRLPSSSLLLETDSPSIGIETVRSPNVRPYHVHAVAECIARLRGVALDELVVQTDENARSMFGDEVMTPMIFDEP
jgi:TatD DNase family protein